MVLSHLGFDDGGYGYGIPIYGDQTLAQKLIAAGKPANLIIGGHSHTDLAAATLVSGNDQRWSQAYYNGRRVGRADITVTGWNRCRQLDQAEVRTREPTARLDPSSRCR